MEKKEFITAMQKELNLYKDNKSKAKPLSNSMKEVSLWLATKEK
ncbi:MAG: hypothetical protein U9O86_10105 [Campylobacterota bacterium]|nr:hypothetical protein [Campylobacterota bacterium]